MSADRSGLCPPSDRSRSAATPLAHPGPRRGLNAVAGVQKERPIYKLVTPWQGIFGSAPVTTKYSENVVDTLHKKILLLGEDRYLTTLMLKITIHNLAELILVRDLCRTFCFSMQFVIRMVLPAAVSFTVYLIIASILSHHANTTISLILLAVVLGLPMVLIVITSRKWVYVGWMLIYLTRVLEGGEAGGKGDEVEGDKEGEFDSSHIVMKQWAEFERERRWKSGTQSRDSDEYFKGKADSNRYSRATWTRYRDTFLVLKVRHMMRPVEPNPT
ncbi:chitin synthase-domain-containing protein [Mycena olivaceomarginata]|nr:chitin synthase-domain-containing protein [Mycena olivaceomarginata]